MLFSCSIQEMKAIAVTTCALIFASCVSASSFLDGYIGSFVEQVNPETFDEKVLRNERLVILQLYAPYSPNCKRLTETWVDLAAYVQTKQYAASVAIMNADEHREFARRFKVDSYPTIITFGRCTKLLSPEYWTKEPIKLEDLMSHVDDQMAVTQEECDRKNEEAQKIRELGRKAGLHLNTVRFF